MTKSEIANAFSNGNFEICFDYLTENTTWNTPGEQFLNNNPAFHEVLFRPVFPKQSLQYLSLEFLARVKYRL